MSHSRFQAAIRHAVSEVRERIREDAERLPPRLRPVLAHLEEHLLDPQLTAGAAVRAARGQASSLTGQFRELLGRTVLQAIADYRMRVAGSLLRATRAPVWKIGEAVGYGVHSSFSRAFREWAGASPLGYRRAARPVPADGVPPPDPVTWRELEQALEGRLEEDGVRRLLDRLQGLYPGLFAAAEEASPFVVDVDGRDFEELLAGKLWREIEELPHAGRLAAVRRVRFSSRVFFDLLRERGRVESRRDRRAGVEIAVLALESVRLSRSRHGGAFAELEALAWAWLGQAQRLAGELREAAESFVRAEVEWYDGTDRRDSAVRAQIYVYEAALRLDECRLDDCRNLARRAVRILEGLAVAEPQLLAQALLLAANADVYAGEPVAALATLEQLQPRVEQLDPQLRGSFRTLAALAHCDLENRDQAERELREAEALSGQLTDPLAVHQIRWLRGILDREQGRFAAAEASLRSAIAGFEDFPDQRFAAVASLDLAVLYLQAGRFEDARETVDQSLVLLGVLRLAREAIAARELLAEALRAEQLSAALVIEVRNRLNRLACGIDDRTHVDGTSLCQHAVTSL